MADLLGVLQTLLAYVAVASYYIEYKLTMQQQVMLSYKAS